MEVSEPERTPSPSARRTAEARRDAAMPGSGKSDKSRTDLLVGEQAGLNSDARAAGKGRLPRRSCRNDRNGVWSPTDGGALCVSPVRRGGATARYGSIGIPGWLATWTDIDQLVLTRVSDEFE